MPGGGSRHVRRTILATVAVSTASALAGGGGLAASPPTDAPRMSVTGSYPHGYIEFTANPASVLTASVIATNPASGTATFLFSGVDGYTSPSGGVVYGDRQTPFRDGPSGNGEFGAGTWITLDRSQATLGPGYSVKVTAHIAVPPGTHPGDWVGAILGENPVAGSAAGAGSTSVRVKSAAAIAVVVHVPGPVSQGQVFLDRPTVRSDGAQQLLDIPLRYTGDVLTKPLFSFRIRDSSGRVVYQHSGRFDTFMPHTTITYEVALSPFLQPGAYTFTGTVGPDGAEQTFSFPIRIGSVPSVPNSGGGQPGQQAEGAGPGGWPAWLWGVIGLLTLMLIAVGVALLALSRRCTHCGRARLWGLLPVSDYAELARCPHCLAAARERKRVQLCPQCYRGHVLPAAQETVAAR